VHLYGESCDLASLRSLCDDEGLDLIEDCAQACGTLYRGEPVGTWGRFAAFSFYPTKNLAAFGDGGALVVNRPGDAETARRNRFYGWDGRRQAVQFGVNSRLDELQAWVLLGKLDHLRSQIAARRQVARWYRERLQHLASDDVVLPADAAAFTTTRYSGAALVGILHGPVPATVVARTHRLSSLCRVANANTTAGTSDI
jgi:dTDP-4-amino-4,6-dideoxygalactose transaminase